MEVRNLDGRVVGELKLPRRAQVLQQDFAGDVITRRISGRGYRGGHDVADRLGWPTSYPKPPSRTIAWWDDTEEGQYTYYDPAIVVVLPYPQPTAVEGNYALESMEDRVVLYESLTGASGPYWMVARDNLPREWVGYFGFDPQSSAVRAVYEAARAWRYGR